MREFCILSMPVWWMTAAATYSIHFTTSSYIKWNTMRSQADLEIPALDLSFDFLFRNRSLDFPLILRILHFVRTCVLCPENQKLVFVKSFLWRVRSRRINGLSRFTRSKWALNISCFLLSPLFSAAGALFCLFDKQFTLVTPVTWGATTQHNSFPCDREEPKWKSKRSKWTTKISRP